MSRGNEPQSDAGRRSGVLSGELRIPYVHELLSDASLRAYRLPAGEALPSGQPAQRAYSQRIPYVHELVSEQTRIGILARQHKTEPAPAHGADGFEALRHADGSLRAGPYVLGERLGEGGMGVVFKSQHPGTGQALAIKILRTADLSQSLEIARFRAEIASQARLRHPGICRLVDFGHQGAIDYLAMELIDGVSFDRWIERNQPGFPRIAEVIADAADAIAYANAQGIIHRDLNPANIMVREDGSAVVMDFGLARDLDGPTRLTVTGIAIGTPPYMSPEGTLGKVAEVGPATDVWGLGAVLYFGLAGRQPFSGKNNHEIFTRILDEDPPPPQSLKPGVPKALQQICQRCMQKPIPDRYPDARALAVDLRRFCAGERLRVRLPGLLTRGMRRARRHRAVVAVALAMSVLLLGAGLWLALEYQRRWSGWVLLPDVAAANPDGLTPVELKVMKSASRAKPPAGPELRFISDGGPPWFAVRAPGSDMGVRIDLDIEFDKADSVEIAINAASTPLPDIGHLPAAWNIKLNRAPKPALLLAWMAAPGPPTQPDNYLSPLLRADTKTLHVTAIRRDQELTLFFDGVQVAALADPMALIRRDQDTIALRAWQDSTRIRNLTVHRLSQPEFADPCLGGDTLLLNGKLDEAMAQYQQLAHDFRGGQLGERALFKACALGLRISDLGAEEPAFPAIAKNFRGTYPDSRFLRHVLRMQAEFDWKKGRLDAALDTSEELDADTRVNLLLRFCSIDQIRASRAQAQRILRLLAKDGTGRIESLRLHALNIGDLSLLKALPLKRLSLDHCQIDSIEALAGMGISHLQLNNNEISDLRPLAGKEFELLELINNRISDVSPLASVRAKTVKLSVNPITTIPRLAGEGPSELALNLCPISSLSGLQTKGLRSLDVENTQVEDLGVLADAPLATLRVSFTKVRDLAPIAGKNLDALSCFGCRGIQGLDRLGGIKDLGASDCGITDAGPLLPLVSRRLALSCNPLREPLLLKTSPSLQYLFLTKCGLTAWPSIEAPSLLTLEMQGNRLAQVPEDALSGLPKVDRLNLLDNPLERIPGLLARQPNLLMLTASGISPNDLQGLHRCLVAQGRTREAISHLAENMLARGEVDDLRLLAQRIGGSDFLVVPGGFGHAQAQAIADACHARLGVVTEPTQMLELARWIAKHRDRAWVGFEVGDDGPGWRGAPGVALRKFYEGRCLPGLYWILTDGVWLRPSNPDGREFEEYLPNHARIEGPGWYAQRPAILLEWPRPR